MMRESVIVRISCVVCQLWPTAQVKTYGSYATQLYLPNRYEGCSDRVR